MIGRALAQRIRKLSKYYPVIVVTGPRQSGKTTLVKNIFPSYDYINLEDPDVFDFGHQDPKGLLKIGDGKKMIIDEAHRIPELFSYIMVEVDEKKIPAQFVLTGSQHLGLTAKVTQSLAGRSGNFFLLPFTLDELKKGRQKVDDFQTMAIRGFYPRLYDVKIPIREYYRNYVFTYIERDVRQLKNIGNLAGFQRFMQLVAGRAGQLVNFSSLGSDVGVDYKTIESWLSVLEESFIIFKLPPYFVNFGKRVVKSPKIYFYDTGLLCYLLGIDSAEELNSHFAYGSIFENFVIADYYKRLQNKGSNDRIFFWRDSNGNEVDLLVDGGGVQIPIEMKAGKTFSPDMLKGLEFWQSVSKGKEKGHLVYNGEVEQNVQGNKIQNWKSFCLE